MKVYSLYLALMMFTVMYTIEAPAQDHIQEKNAALLSGLQYRCVGPARGGRVTAVAGHADEMFTFYMGSTGGGVWKTTDGGLNWNNVSDGYFSCGSIGAVTVTPSDPNVIYVGTGSAEPRGNISPGCGIYRSTNGGQSWELIGLENAGQIARIEVHPEDPDLVYVAVLGNVFGPNPQRGVYRSKDGGQNWEKVLYVSDRTGAIDLAMDLRNPRILYAGMWTAQRTPWTMIDGSDEGGVWKSTDGGSSWTQLGGGLPTGTVGKVGIAVSPADPERVWVIQEAKDESKGGIYRSDDGGKRWQRINREHELRQRAWYYNHIFADPQDANTVYVLNVGFWRSVDGGRNFQRIRTPHSDNHALWINPDHTQVMIEGNDGGACVTFNGGQSWTTQNNQPTAEFYRLAVDNQFPYRLYGAQQDNSTISVPSRSQNALTPQQEWYPVGGGESGHIAVDPRNPHLIYAGNYIGQITRMDLARGHARDIVAYPQMHDGTAPRDIRYRFQWNAPIRISPHDPQTVYHCSQYVHRTRDGGRSWETISPDLTTDQDKYQDIPGGPIQHDHTGVELYTTIFAFEESPHQAGELWAGSDDGLLHLSRDDGANWSDITPPTLPEEGTINMIELSPHGPGRALIAVYKYRENDFRPYIFLTDNYGKNWKLLTNGQNGIPADHFVRVVREDPEKRGLLYAGTEFGMYWSEDNGANWEPLQLNLPVTPVTDLAVHQGDLVVATQGRSFWILDDISPLRTLTDRSSVALLPVRPAYRTQLRNPRGADIPETPPNGAIVYVYLPENPDSSQRITLAIRDAEGKDRRIFSTQPIPPHQSRMELKKGLNRIVWDLSFERPVMQPKSVFSLANLSGIKVPPGQYTAVLKMDDQTYEQSILVQADPRWEETGADLQAQYELGMKVKELFNEVHAAIGKLRTIRSRVDDLTGRLQEGEDQQALRTEGNTISDRLYELEKQLIQVKSESGQDPINYPSMIDDQIAYLYSIVNSQDARPTEGAYQRYEDLKNIWLRYEQQIQEYYKGPVKNYESELSEAGVGLIFTE